MNDYKLSPDQIISGTESGYTFDLPLAKKPVTLWDKLYSNKKEQLLLEWCNYPFIVNKIIDTLQNEKYYWSLTLEQVIQLYRFTNTDYINTDQSQLMHGDNFFDNGY